MGVLELEVAIIDINLIADGGKKFKVGEYIYGGRAINDISCTLYKEVNETEEGKSVNILKIAEILSDADSSIALYQVCYDYGFDCEYFIVGDKKLYDDYGYLQEVNSEPLQTKDSRVAMRILMEYGGY